MSDEWPFTRETAATEHEQWERVQAQLAAAERRGYDRAVANLRDTERLREWHAAELDAYQRMFVPIVGNTGPELLARYLEATKETTL